MRHGEDPAVNSYTAKLFAQGKDEIIKKVGEEAIEVVLAAKGQTRERLIEEVADLAYHTLVLLAASDLTSRRCPGGTGPAPQKIN